MMTTTFALRTDSGSVLKTTKNLSTARAWANNGHTVTVEPVD